MDAPYEIPDEVVDMLMDEGAGRKAFREHAGVSVAGLAEATDISDGAPRCHLKHRATPTGEELARISDALARTGKISSSTNDPSLFAGPRTTGSETSESRQHQRRLCSPQQLRQRPAGDMISHSSEGSA